MFIYRIYNIDTNESYIGQTVKAIDDRFKEHIREAKRSFRGEKRDFSFFHRALLYYGIEKFKIEELEEVSDALADAREIYWIEYYDSYYSGYNSTKGGQHRPMSELQSETDKKWKEPNPNKMNIQDVIAAGLYNPIGNTNAGKKVGQFTLDGELIKIYPAATTASQETGVNVGGIRRVCNNKQQKCGGYLWKWL